MNPYDPNDALSDKSDEYTPGDTLTTIEERTEEFPIEGLNLAFDCLRSPCLQPTTEGSSGEDYVPGEEFVSGEVTSEDTNFKFTDHNNEIDANTEVLVQELKKAFNQSPGVPATPNQSCDLAHLLEEAKELFVPPSSSPKTHNAACSITSSGMELLEIEAKLRECHLVKSNHYCRADVRRLNQLTIRKGPAKPAEHQQDTSSELKIQPTDEARHNFCELLYKSTLLGNVEEHPQQEDHTSNDTDNTKSQQLDDLTIISRALQLLESRTSIQSLPSNCRGLLGILALQQKLKELSVDKEELENRLYKCNTDFMEFIDILSDKARIISINNKEVANYIKILNLKVPELEKITAAHTESLEDIKYRFKERNVAKIIELRKQIEFYSGNINKLNKKIAKINTENTDIRQQMEGLDEDNLSYKTYFTKKIAEVRANMENLSSLNHELQRQLEIIQNSDLGKNENFKQKVPALKQEIENISNTIKQVRRDKNKYEMENSELRKKLKQLILAKVMENRGPVAPRT